MTYEEAKERGEAVCYVYCKPCEFYGICPHSYAEFDKEKEDDTRRSN